MCQFFPRYERAVKLTAGERPQFTPKSVMLLLPYVTEIVSSLIVIVISFAIVHIFQRTFS